MRDTITNILHAGILAMLAIIALMMAHALYVGDDKPARTAHWYQSGECMVWSENTSIMRCHWSD